MKKVLLVLFLLFYPFSANAVTQTFSATAKIVSAITISQVTAIDFGTVLAGAGSATTLTLNFSDQVSQTGSKTLGGTPKTGVYTVTGMPNTAVQISYANVVNLSSGSNSLPTTINLSPSSSLTLDSSGNGTIKVGGTLSIPASPTVGVYSGSFDLTVQY